MGVINKQIVQAELIVVKHNVIMETNHFNYHHVQDITVQIVVVHQ